MKEFILIIMTSFIVSMIVNLYMLKRWNHLMEKWLDKFYKDELNAIKKLVDKTTSR